MRFVGDLIAVIIFLIIITFLLSFQIIYAIAKDVPQCAFARDVISCVEISKK